MFVFLVFYYFFRNRFLEIFGVFFSFLFFFSIFNGFEKKTSVLQEKKSFHDFLGVCSEMPIEEQLGHCFVFPHFSADFSYRLQLKKFWVSETINKKVPK